MSETAAIIADSIGKTYYLGVNRRPVEALRHVSFEVKAGEVFAFLGLNGAGKTTTIKMLLDHARPSTGRCFLFGVDSQIPHSRTKVGYMPDLPNFYRFLTASELLDYFGRLHGLHKSERTTRSRRLFSLVGLEGRENEPLNGFSRGMLQRVGLAQALIGEPELLILDEPLGGLDPKGRYEFHAIISSLKAEGRTIFFSSHILDDAEKVADRVGIIHKGTLVASGSMAELVMQESGFEVELRHPPEPTSLHNFCASKGWSYTVSDSITSITVPHEENLTELMKFALDSNLQIYAVTPQRKTLEMAFISELEKWKQ